MKLEVCNVCLTYHANCCEGAPKFVSSAIQVEALKGNVAKLKARIAELEAEVTRSEDQAEQWKQAFLGEVKAKANRQHR